MKKNVNIILCDNVGENKIIKENSAEKLEEIKFKFISPVTPQKNGVVEQGFYTLHYQMRAMTAYVVIHENLKNGLRHKCAATPTKLENIIVKLHKEKCAHKKFYWKIPDYAT